MWEANARANIPFVKHTIDELPNFKFKRPAIVAGAGYGLEDKLVVLADRRVFLTLPILIVSDKALPKCIERDVIPDYVVALNTENSSEVRIAAWFSCLLDVRLCVNLILPITAHPEHVRQWLKNEHTLDEIYWMVPSNIDTDLADELSNELETAAIPRGSNSGEFAYLMACFMQCSPIGLIGMPYAYRTLVECLKGQSKDKYDYHHFYTDGLNCYSTLGWMSQRTAFLETVNQYSTFIKTFNCSEGGILYDQTCPRSTIEEFLDVICEG